MKKIFTVILNSAFLILNCTAQTNVSGFISANTTWNLAGSPYVVVGNVLLSQGYTLTINPGVVVKFDSAKTIQIDGELIAVGNAASRITFTSNQTFPTPGYWGKIQFTSLSTGAIFDTNGNYVSGNIFRYCDLMYGGGIGNGIVHVNGSKLCVSNCRISYSSTNGIYCSGFMKMDSSSVRNCTNVGWVSSGSFSPYCPYTIEYDTLEYNTGGGISGINSTCSAIGTLVRNCYFRQNSGSSAFSSGGYKFLIRENQFLNNSGGNAAIYIDLDASSTIECNLFLNNQRAIYIDGDENDTIRHNRFESNSSTVIDIVAMCCSQKVISDNYFLNNTSGNGTIINMLGNTTDQYFITGNEFIGSHANSELYIMCSGSPTLQFANISNNNFLSDSVQYVIKNTASFGGPILNADSNYWNSTSTQHVDSMIYDFFDDANKSVVYYSPILTSLVVIDTACSPVIITGTNNINIEASSTFSLFPNPFTTTATIKFSTALYSATFRLYNVYGQKIMETSGISGESFRINAEETLARCLCL